MRRFIVPLLLLPMLSGCVASALASAAVSVVTLPVKVASAGVDAVTTSQSEADENRGRKARRDEERVGRDAKRAEVADKRAVEQNQKTQKRLSKEEKKAEKARLEAEKEQAKRVREAEKRARR